MGGHTPGSARRAAVQQPDNTRALPGVLGGEMRGVLGVMETTIPQNGGQKTAKMPASS
jgi:hypothetical protein